MTKEYIIYSDESDAKGEYFSNFYGGVLVKSDHIDRIKADLNEIKLEQNLHGEVKWSKVTAQYVGKYMVLMERFFDYVKQDLIKVRIMFRQNAFAPEGLDKYQKEHGYHLLYYQFIKHAFGLTYSNNRGTPITLRIYLDKLPDTKEKNKLFKAHLVNLQEIKKFRIANIRIKADQITEVTSHNHVILQCLDVSLGAIQFRLNNKHLVKAAGTNRRGKKTIAKDKFYKWINKNIRETYPNFNIGITTGLNGDYANLWFHKYRHWRFVPKNSRVDFSGSKTQKRKAP
jgi:hypothetical protein